MTPREARSLSEALDNPDNRAAYDQRAKDRKV